MSWQTESLGNLLAPSGNTRAGKENLPVLSITMHGGLVDQTAKFKKRVASKDISSYRVVYTNELVVGFPIDEGVLGFQTKYPAAVVSPAYGIWKLRRPAETHVPFIEGYLRSSEARKIYANKMRGAVARRRSLNREDFLGIEIPFPPLGEQRRIAVVLGKADLLHSNRQEFRELTERLIQSLFLKTFGDPVTNPRGWPLVNFGREIEEINYGTSVKCSESAEGGSRAVLRIPNVASGRISWDNLKFAILSPSEWSSLKLIPGDILFVRTNGNPSMVARTAVFDGVQEAAFASYLIRVRLKAGSRMRPEFINFLLSTPSYRATLLKLARTTAGNYNINTQAIKKLELIAPDLELQNRFCQTLIDQRSFAEILGESSQQARLLFSSLEHLAFKGELDLGRVALDSLSVIPPALEAEKHGVAVAKRKAGAALLQTPAGEEGALRILDDTVSKGEAIPWSVDYFKFRILGTTPTPFSFSEIMQRAESVFEDPLYEEMKDIMLDLLGRGGGHPVLRQIFDLHIDEKTKEVSGRKEIVFGPVA